MKATCAGLSEGSGSWVGLLEASGRSPTETNLKCQIGVSAEMNGENSEAGPLAWRPLWDRSVCATLGLLKQDVEGALAPPPSSPALSGK